MQHFKAPVLQKNIFLKNLKIKNKLVYEKVSGEICWNSFSVERCLYPWMRTSIVTKVLNNQADKIVYPVDVM